jgi:hypothetical protein
VFIHVHSWFTPVFICAHLRHLWLKIFFHRCIPKRLLENRPRENHREAD